MSKYEIRSKTLHQNFNYENDQLNINGSSQQDGYTGELKIISGTAYKIIQDGEQPKFIGNFSGYKADGVMNYTLGEMTLEDMVIVREAINDIESKINSSNN